MKELASKSPGRATPRLHLDDLVDRALLSDAIAGGLVSVRGEGSLRVLNYTARATYSRVWTRATRLCRGLVVDDGNRVVARPFPKFFAPSEPDAPPAPEGVPMVVHEKFDGSLGIAYHHPDGGIRLATRGSLSSDQAEEATRIWQERYSDVRFGEDITPLFEIIYPDNRVVVDYGSMRDLVLLAVIDIRTGADLPLGCLDWPGPVAASHEVGSFADLADHVAAGAESAREGYVVRFDMGSEQPHVRFKFKFPEYVVAHRIVTGLTSLRVWEVAAVADAVDRGLDVTTTSRRLRMDPATVEAISNRTPDPVDGLRAGLPEEFWPWYDAAVRESRAAVGRRIEEYESLVRMARSESGATGGRDFAEAALRLCSERGLASGPVFALNKGRTDVYASIWAAHRPTGGGDRPDR
ncbi:MAG: hypothetical protein OXS29_10430 [bacterium]|nr:hypothetical protein [bacterium]MDE0287086.1 hypothetical protein [bacterium]MDE0440124.1 hypothetical protein [bacterium]